MYIRRIELQRNQLKISGIRFDSIGTFLVCLFCKILFSIMKTFIRIIMGDYRVLDMVVSLKLGLLY